MSEDLMSLSVDYAIMYDDICEVLAKGLRSNQFVYRALAKYCEVLSPNAEFDGMHTLLCALYPRDALARLVIRTVASDDTAEDVDYISRRWKAVIARKRKNGKSRRPKMYHEVLSRGQLELAEACTIVCQDGRADNLYSSALSKTRPAARPGRLSHDEHDRLNTLQVEIPLRRLLVPELTLAINKCESETGTMYEVASSALEKRERERATCFRAALAQELEGDSLQLNLGRPQEVNDCGDYLTMSFDERKISSRIIVGALNGGLLPKVALETGLSGAVDMFVNDRVVEGSSRLVVYEQERGMYLVSQIVKSVHSVR